MSTIDDVVKARIKAVYDHDGTDWFSHYEVLDALGLDPGAPFTSAADDITYDQAHQQLVAALTACLDHCDSVFDGTIGQNLPEMLSQALTEIAMKDGSWRLIKHRPGSWEATHITALDCSGLYR